MSFCMNAFAKSLPLLCIGQLWGCSYDEYQMPVVEPSGPGGSSAAQPEETLRQDHLPAGPVLGAPSQVDPAEICPGACQTVATCEPALNVAACDAQCTKEISGLGYLSIEIATDFFTTLRDLEEDPQCDYSGQISSKYWQKWDYKTPAIVYEHELDDLASLLECKDIISGCHQAYWNDEGTYYWCFHYFYIHNEPVRRQVRSQAETPCKLIPMFSHAPIHVFGSPWLAGFPGSGSLL